jgi:hyperosmotically inducible protein
MRRSGGNPVALRVRAWPAVRLLLALASFTAVTGAATGSDAAPSAGHDPYRDIKLSKKVRDALKEDPQLSLLKLRVTVKDRVAILEGSVTTEDQLREAAKRVEKLSGIAEVRTGLVKVVALKEEIDLTIPLEPEPPTRTEAQSPIRVTGAVARPTTLPRGGEPIPEIVAIRLNAPIPLPPPGAEPLTSLRAPALPDDFVSSAVERARQANPRFRALGVEARGDVVWLRGSAEQVDACMDFAQALTDLGVRHVVIQCTASDER